MIKKYRNDYNEEYIVNFEEVTVTEKVGNGLKVVTKKSSMESLEWWLEDNAEYHGLKEVV